MSYDKVIKQLENPAVKMDKLAQYAQGSNPRVPEFLALAEIKRRQSLVALSPVPAQTTVQEDLTRVATPQPMPQQIAGLQAMQRPQGVAALPSGMNERSLAGGGIVAFAGDTGSLVNEDEEGLSSFEKFKRYINNLGGGVMPRGGAPVNALPGQIQAVRSGRGSGIPMTSDQVKNMMPADPIQGDESKLFQAEALAKQIAPQGQALPTVGERGRMAATTEGAPKEDMYAKYEEMLKGQAAETKAGRDQDKYMRLLEAGLGIMGGTSQHALQNIGQGAMGAAKGYAQDKSGYRKEDRENIKELMGLGMKKEEAQREAEKLAMTKELYGAHGRYYDAAAKAAGVKAAGTSGMDKAKLAAVTSRYNAWARLNPMATAEEQQAKMSEIEQQVGMSGSGSAAPVVMGTYSLKGGYSPAGS